MGIGKDKRGDWQEITEERKIELKGLAEQPDSKIGCTDIPPLDDTVWGWALPGLVVGINLGLDRMQPIDARLVERIQSLTGSIEVDLDKPLLADDE